MTGLPASIGPYKIDSLLGRGGMGYVYRGHHPETGRVVAVKTVRVPHPRQAEGIRREIRALARIDHPGVVKILDEGIQDGLPWYAMEYLEGVSLRQFCSEFLWGGSKIATAWAEADLQKAVWEKSGSGSRSSWWNRIHGATMDAEDIPVPEPGSAIKASPPENGLGDPDRPPAAGGQLQMVLTMAAQLAKTLAYLHGKGVVHGDLKPDNVLIRSDGFPVIIDFGMVTRIWDEVSRESLDSETIKGGTLIYIAPEQITGQVIDARSDLYSFGCILYELSTGRLPFDGSTVLEIVRAQVEREPVLPSLRSRDIPVELDSLIMNLLAKKPRHRIGYAGDVVMMLLDLGADESALEQLPQPDSYLYRSRFAGRKKEISELNSHLDHLENGQGNLVLIHGQSGIGKTRFLMELFQEVKKRRIFLLSGEGPGKNSPGFQETGKHRLPLYPLRRPLQLIAEYCLEKGRDETSRVLGIRGKVLEMYEPSLAQAPGQDALPDPPDLAPNAAHLRLYTYLAEVFAAVAGAQKCVLILDDLQWADELTLGFIEFIHRIGRLKAMGLLIIGAYRPEEITPSLQRLSQSGAPVTIILEKLDKKAVDAILNDMLVLNKSYSSFVDFLTVFSEGNPFFISEYLRTAVAEGVLFRDNMGYWHLSDDTSRAASREDFKKIPLPNALSDLVNRRLTVLSESAMDVISAASVIGRDIPSLLLWNLIPFTDRMLDTVDELIKRQILQETVPGEFQFVHDKIRDSVYTKLPDTRRSYLHGKTALAMEMMYGVESRDNFAALAKHWERGGGSKKAGQYYLAEARYRESMHALSEADRAYKKYLGLVTEPELGSIEAALEYAKKVLTIQGRHTDALGVYQTAQKNAEKIGNLVLEAYCILGQSKMQKTIANMEESRDLCNRALELFQNEGHESGKAESQVCLGDVWFQQGRFDEARKILENALEKYQELGDQHAVGSVYASLAPIHCIQGDMVRGRQLFEQAVAIHQALGDRQFEGTSLANIANIHLYKGEYDQAIRQYEVALAILREIGDIRNQAIILGNMGRVRYFQNQFEASRELYLEALAIHREIQNRRLEATTLVKMGNIHLACGEPDIAWRMYREGLEMQCTIRDRQNEAETLLDMAAFRRLIHASYNRAEEDIDHAENIFREMGDQLGLGLSYYQRGLLVLAQGESAGDYFRKIGALMEDTHSDLESQLGQAFQRLKTVIDSRATGVALFRGELQEYLPPGLRKWFAEKGILMDSKADKPVENLRGEP